MVSLGDQQKVLERKVVFDHRRKVLSTLKNPLQGQPLQRQTSLEQMFAKFIPTLKPTAKRKTMIFPKIESSIN